MIQPLAVAVGHVTDLAGMEMERRGSSISIGVADGSHGRHQHAAAVHDMAGMQEASATDHCQSGGDCQAGSCCFLALSEYLLFLPNVTAQRIEAVAEDYRSNIPLLPFHPPTAFV